MLTRNDELTSPEKFISDNLTHKPDVAQSAYDNLAAGIVTAPYAIKSFDQEFNESPRGKTVGATFEALRRGNENPEVGWTQWGVNEAANMLGQTLNPLGFMFAEAGGLAVRPVTAVAGRVAPQLFKKPIKEILGEKMGKYFPEMIGSEAEKQTLSMGLFGKELTKGFGIGAGAMLPQSVIDNFNAETGKHDILGIATGMGAGGIFGMSIGTIPFAWGILKANVNRLRGRAATEKITPNEITKLVEEGTIDEDTAQFMRDMDINITPEGRQNAKKFQDRATKFVAEQGHPVDHANDTAQFEILNREQINNLQSATTDQLVSDNIPEEHRNALSDFTVQAGMDEMRNKPNLLDGVRGYVDYMDANLLNRDAILSSADRLVDEHILLNTELAPLDQKVIFDVLKKYGSDSELPFYVPDNIRSLARKNESEFKKYIKEIDNKFERLDVTDDFTKHDFYHGTGQLENINEFDITRAAQHNLYGAGLYITDSKKVASGYAKSRAKPSRKPTGKILELKFKKNPKLIDVEQPTPKNVFSVIKEQAESFADIELSEKMKEKPIKNIFEIIRSEIEDEHDYGWQEIYSELLDHINFTLSEKGYDGYLHTGGKIVGKRDHNVIVLFGHDYSFQGKNYKRNPAEHLNQNLIDLQKDFEEKYSSLKESIEAIKNPVEELTEIKEKILPVQDNLRETKEYQRLADLAEVWSPAQTLLDRVHLEEEIRKQEAYRDLARQMLDIADSNVGAVAKVENINGYMEARTKSRIDEHNPKAELIELAKANEVPADADVMIAEHDRAIEALDHKETKAEYEAAKDRFAEFKKSEGVFKNFINCVMGSQK